MENLDEEYSPSLAPPGPGPPDDEMPEDPGPCLEPCRPEAAAAVAAVDHAPEEPPPSRRFAQRRALLNHPKSFYYGDFFIKYRADESLLYPDRIGMQ